ncbi:MAG TPA: acyl carrier protein [archaeon]|nr:acyl carrier protein [archaeon]
MGLVGFFGFYSKDSRNEGEARRVEIERKVYSVLYQVGIVHGHNPETNFANGHGHNQHDLEFLQLVLRDHFKVVIPVDELASLDTVRKISYYIERRADTHIL